MKTLKRRKKEKLEITREEWDIMREFRKTPFKERFMKYDYIWNSQ